MDPIAKADVMEKMQSAWLIELARRDVATPEEIATLSWQPAEETLRVILSHTPRYLAHFGDGQYLEFTKESLH